MRLTSGPAAFVACLLALGATLGFSGTASATTVAQPAGTSSSAGVTMTGSSPTVAHWPGTVTFSYTIDVPAGLSSMVFTTIQPDELPASFSAVLLDGVAVPAGQISRPDANDLAVRTGASPADGLSAGIHTLSFSALVASQSAASTKSSATLSWLDGAHPGSVTAAVVPIALNQPDLSVRLTPQAGEEQAGLLGAGRDLDFEVDVANLGYGTPQSTLSIALPIGLKLGADGVSREGDGRTLSCRPASARVVECDLGMLLHTSLNNDPTLELDLTSTPAAPIGRTVAITVSARPNPGEGDDADPGNNAATGRVHFTGSARLSYTVTPTKIHIPLGGKGTVRLSIHNAGPQASPQTVAFTIVIGSNFRVTGFTGKLNGPLPPPGPLSDPQPVMGVGSTSGTELVWLVGDIPAGHSVTAMLTIKALRLGVAKVGLTAFSGAADPSCPDYACDPKSVSVAAVAAPAKAVTKPIVRTRTPTSSAPTSGPMLPVTGQASGPLLELGLGFLLAGCGLVLFGRRQAGC